MKRSIFISAVFLGLSLTGCGALSADKSSEPEKQSDTENMATVDFLENINVKAMPVNSLVNNDDRESELNAAFPSYSVRSFGNNWETVKTTESRSSFNGVQVDKGTPVLQLSSYAYDSAIDVPLGAPFPDLRIGDEQNGDYSVSFDFCADENGKLLFTMFDESEVKADDYLGNQAYWYCLDCSGAVSFETTFGVGYQENIAAAENYNADVWNNCVLKSVDDKIEMYINGNFVAELPNPDPNKHGRLALSGAKGLTLKDFVFSE